MRASRLLPCLASLAVATICACATPPAADAVQQGVAGAGQWAANGWLTPGPTSEPELIGVFDVRAECEAAVDGWMSRQVVGNPVYGECLPVDRK